MVQLSMESDPDLARAMHRTVDRLLNVVAARTPSSVSTQKSVRFGLKLRDGNYGVNDLAHGRQK
jgi:hypothetical protein